MTATAIDHYCVFEVAEELFAASATQIREITSKPDFAKVPCGNPSLAGLWHEGSEFLPVLRLPFHTGCPMRETQVLVVHSPQGRWGLLVDHVHTVATIECIHGSDTSDMKWSNAMQGMSTWEGRSVRVLNLDGVYRLTEQSLERDWNNRCANDEIEISPEGATHE